MDFAHHTIEVGAELLDIGFLRSRDKYARRILLRKPTLLQVIKRAILLGRRGEVVFIFRSVGVGVNLVENQIYRFFACANILQGLLHDINLLLELRMRNINNMDKQIREKLGI